MIKFFRRIRQRLLTENKVSKYLLYAVGEIVLVVIGILIALQINNKNQERLTEEKFKATLVEIQSDIASDIRVSNFFIGRYIKRDSIKNLIFNNKVTYDDIKSGRIKPRNAAFIYDLMYINSNGFEKLRQEFDDIPDKYNGLITSLNFQYQFTGTYLEDVAQAYIDDLHKNTDYRINNLDWYAQDLFNNSISDQQIDFYLNDPKYKDLVMYMSNDAAGLLSAIIQYRGMALISYFKIEELLADKAFETPNYIRRTSLSDAKQADSIIGTYKLTEGPSNTKFGAEIKITSEGKNLYAVVNDNEPIDLKYWHPEKLEFYSNFARRSILRFSSKTPNKLTIMNGNIDQTEWEKVL